HGRIRINIGAKVIPDHADARQVSGFLLGYSIRLTGPPLQAARDVAFHHFGWHAWVQRQDLHGWCAESWQNICWDAAHCHGAEKDHRECSDHYYVWIVERSFYQAVFLSILRDPKR